MSASYLVFNFNNVRLNSRFSCGKPAITEKTKSSSLENNVHVGQVVAFEVAIGSQVDLAQVGQPVERVIVNIGELIEAQVDER